MSASAAGAVIARPIRLAAAPLVTLYKQYVLRFELGYSEEARDQVELVGHTAPVRLRYATPLGPLGY